MLAQERLDALVAEGQVSESFQQMNKVLTVLLLERACILGMSNQRLYHAFSTL